MWRTLHPVSPLLVSGVLSCVALLSPTGALAQSGVSRPLVFDRVTVIDVEHGLRVPQQRVVIVGTHIQAVGSAQRVPLPVGAQVVDAQGKFLIPGLWDMHTHSMRATNIFYPLFIANGVTGIRDAGSPVPLDTLRLWRQEILAGTRVGPPRQLLSGPAIDEGEHCKRVHEKSSDNVMSMHICVADAPDARHVVDSLKAAGADIIKTYTLGRALYFAIAADARRDHIPFGGHLDHASVLEASDSGALIIDHLNTKDLDGRCWATTGVAKEDTASVARCQAVTEHFRRNNTWSVPTLVICAILEMNGPAAEPVIKPIRTRYINFVHQFWTDSALPRNWLRDSVNLPHATQASRENTIPDSSRFLRIAHRAELPIMEGTDVAAGEFMGLKLLHYSLPGFSLHTELTLAVAEGLTPLEALQAATLNPAKALHATDSLGTVASGKLADLVLLDADPLVDIANTTMIQAVIANGRYFNRAALDQLISKARLQGRN